MEVKEGKKYLSGVRMRSATYVVRPSRTIVNHSIGAVTHTPALRARFKEHKFDSGSSEMRQQYEEWALFHAQEDRTKFDEYLLQAQELVENHIEKHPDFGRVDGRGIFPDLTATVIASEKQLREQLDGQELITRCQFYEDVGGETIQCAHNAVQNDPNMLCSTHAAQLQAQVG